MVDYLNVLLIGHTFLFDPFVLVAKVFCFLFAIYTVYCCFSCQSVFLSFLPDCFYSL